MRVLIDANVLFPTVLREIVLGLAETGYFEPLWSERILEEWRRAAARIGEGEIGERLPRGILEKTIFHLLTKLKST